MSTAVLSDERVVAAAQPQPSLTSSARPVRSQSLIAADRNRSSSQRSLSRPESSPPDYLWRSPSFGLPDSCIAAIAAALSLRRSPQLGFALWLAGDDSARRLLSAGSRCRADRPSPRIFSPSLPGRTRVDVTAHVIREGLIRDSPYGGKQESVDVETRTAAARQSPALPTAGRHPAHDLQQAERGRRSARERQRIAAARLHLRRAAALDRQAANAAQLSRSRRAWTSPAISRRKAFA